MHVMYDFETIDNKPSSIVISLGAVAFNKKGIIREGHWVFDIQEQIDKGRTFNADTLGWWMKQKEAARKVFYEKSKDYTSMVDFFIDHEDFLVKALKEAGESDDQLKVWGNGANFDISMLEHLYQNWGLKIPWKFWNVWCFRTFQPFNKNQRTF